MVDTLNRESPSSQLRLEEAKENFSKAKNELFPEYDTIPQLPFASWNLPISKYLESGIKMYKLEKENITYPRKVTLSNANNLPSSIDFDNQIIEFQFALDYLNGSFSSPDRLKKIIGSGLNDWWGEENILHEEEENPVLLELNEEVNKIGEKGLPVSKEDLDNIILGNKDLTRIYEKWNKKKNYYEDFKRHLDLLKPRKVK